MNKYIKIKKEVIAEEFTTARDKYINIRENNNKIKAINAMEKKIDLNYYIESTNKLKNELEDKLEELKTKINEVAKKNQENLTEELKSYIKELKLEHKKLIENDNVAIINNKHELFQKLYKTLFGDVNTNFDEIYNNTRVNAKSDDVDYPRQNSLLYILNDGEISPYYESLLKLNITQNIELIKDTVTKLSDDEINTVLKNSYRNMVLIEKLLEIIDEEVNYYEDLNEETERDILSEFKISREKWNIIQKNANDIIKNKKYENLGIEIDDNGNIKSIIENKTGYDYGLMKNDKIKKIDGKEMKSDGDPTFNISNKIKEEIKKSGMNIIIEVTRELDNKCEDDKSGGRKTINNSFKKGGRITRGRKINKSGKKTLRNSKY